MFYHENYDKIGLKDEYINEYNIMFDPLKNDYKILEQKMSTFNKRVNLWYIGEINIDEVIILNKLNQELYLRVSAEHIHQIQDLKNNNIKFFLDLSIPIYSYSMLYWAINEIQPAEIYIADDLCYNLEEVYKICKKNSIKLRIVLNRIPTINILTGLSETAPIFRPEDLDLLSLYFSTAEFDLSFGEDPRNEYECNWDAAETMYRRWFIQKHWPEDLNIMNPDILIDFPNSSIPIELNEHKIRCRHKCTSSSIGVCGKCGRYMEVGRLINEYGYKISR